MQVHLPKPLHGWRAFFGEVGVVVLGVLLALGAQQLVQDFQIRSDVREFRTTIDREIGMNVYALDLRASQFGCDRQRLAELTKWLDQSRTAPTAPAIYPHPPLELLAESECLEQPRCRDIPPASGRRSAEVCDVLRRCRQ